MDKKEIRQKWLEKRKEHLAEYARQYRIKNKERISKLGKIRRENNKEYHNSLVREWRKNNPEKIKIIQARRYQKHKDKLKEKAKQYRLKNLDKIHITKIKRKFNITEEEYKSLLKKQNNQCAICKREDDYQRIGVDHNHTTGKIRGLLCARCNTGIGFLQDDIKLLKEAIKYLKIYG